MQWNQWYKTLVNNYNSSIYIYYMCVILSHSHPPYLNKV